MFMHIVFYFALYYICDTWLGYKCGCLAWLLKINALCVCGSLWMGASAEWLNCNVNVVLCMYVYANDIFYLLCCFPFGLQEE